MTWHGLHIHYHEERLDDLVLDAIRPLFARIGDEVRRAYFVPHWKRGPHLRLYVDLEDGDGFGDRIRPAVDEIVGGYLAAHPSRSRLDPEALLPLHERLAAQEQEDGPLLPWLPDNSIQPAEPHDRADILGSREAVELLADFYVHTTDLTFRMLDHARTSGSRLGAAFGLLIALAHTYAPHRITQGFLSFRSHAEGFLNTTAEGPELRERWDEHYRQHRDQLVGQVRAAVDTADRHRNGSGPDEPEVPFVGEWLARLAPIASRGDDLMDRGKVNLLPPSGADANASADSATYDPDGFGEISAFHRLLVTTDWWRTTRTAPWFLRYRLLLNFTYLHLTRLGVRPVQRFMLGHLAANAVEDLYRISAMEELRK